MDDGSQLRVSSCDRDRTWDAAPPGGNDALLRWLEAFADSLKNQLGCCHLHQSTFSFGICLYPTHQPWQVGCASACTLPTSPGRWVVHLPVPYPHKPWQVGCASAFTLLTSPGRWIVITLVLIWCHEVCNCRRQPTGKAAKWKLASCMKIPYLAVHSSPCRSVESQALSLLDMTQQACVYLVSFAP